MAKYDHGGGCPCGLYAECPPDCEYEVSRKRWLSIYDHAPACPVAAAVAQDILTRSEHGVQKYGTTLARTDLSLKDWQQHLYEELLDAAVYLKRQMQEK